MVGHTDSHDGTDGLQQFVRAVGEALYNDPAETPVPMATEDADEVIKAQLTENTGTHFLDSGSAYGRNWEENQETPPWEKPEWNVYRDFVTRNVYHHMTRTLKRDRDCIALEAAMYALREQSGDYGWQLAQAFGEALRDPHVLREEILEPSGLPEEHQAIAARVAGDVRENASSRRRRSTELQPMFKRNTYNSEWGSLSQAIQGVSPAGPYGDVVILQVHQGCDIRGGWTGPRVYKTWDGWWPSEYHFRCEHCGWSDAESCCAYDGPLDYRRDRNQIIHTECGGNIQLG